MSRTSSSASRAAAVRGTSADGRRGPNRGGRRRDAEVLEAATKVFYRQSYADSSVQDVADELGILKGSLYYYIKTKEDLLVWLLDDVHDDVERILQGVQAQSELDALQRLEVYVREQVRYNARNLPRISVYHHDADQLSPAPLKALQQRQRVHDQAVVDMLQEAQDRGEVPRDLDARVLSNMVFAVVIWVYRWYRPNGRVRQEELADVCARFVLAGVTGMDGAAGGSVPGA